MHTTRVKIENFVKRQLLGITNSPLAGYLPPFLPISAQHNSYRVPKAPPHAASPNPRDYPIPPKQLQVGYGNTPELYLQYAEEHVSDMLRVLSDAGYTVQPGQRILDFGCAEGRMTRWFAPYAQKCEVWGTDISAARISWCEHYLNPPFHFATSTTVPHLPFEDRSFDLIYSGSVFTHIDDLAKTWLLELRRIMRSGGYLYITVHDQHTIELLRGKWRTVWLAKYMHAHREYQSYIRQPFAMFTIGRALQSQVFYDIEYLRTLLQSIFRVVSVIPEAYSYQTAIIVQKE